MNFNHIQKIIKRKTGEEHLSILAYEIINYWRFLVLRRSEMAAGKQGSASHFQFRPAEGPKRA